MFNCESNKMQNKMQWWWSSECILKIPQEYFAYNVPYATDWYLVTIGYFVRLTVDDDDDDETIQIYFKMEKNNIRILLFYLWFNWWTFANGLCCAFGEYWKWIFELGTHYKYHGSVKMWKRLIIGIPKKGK